ncbi:clavata3/esr (cle)-related protein 6 [Quercus suber]|uniref:Clavata3/esr (Cle)-related protein 6 n=1 Tax=Quercus suber TaxID=58331 RepID=A0AAW0JW95_QUESU
MANRIILRVTILIIIFSSLFMSSQARILHWHKVLQKSKDSQKLLHLGFDLSNLDHFQRRLAVETYHDQVVPGGPDHQHHLSSEDNITNTSRQNRVDPSSYATFDWSERIRMKKEGEKIDFNPMSKTILGLTPMQAAA